MSMLKANSLATDSSAFLKDAAGTIPITLKNDYMFHYCMSHSQTALRSLVGSLLGLKDEEIHEIIVTNPIDYNKLGKETFLDVRLLLNDARIVNVELQVYHDTYWVQRSILYLCRSFDSINAGEPYSALKPAVHISIMNYDLFPEHPEFYARFLLTNIKKGYYYTEQFALNVLSLNRIDMATQEDRASRLDDWARMFRAVVWEDLQELASRGEAYKEVAELMYTISEDDQKRAIFQAHQDSIAKYRTLAEEAERAIKARMQADQERAIAEEARTRADQERARAGEQRAQAEEQISHMQEEITLKDIQIRKLEELLQKNGISVLSR